MADESYNLMLDPSMFLSINSERRLEVMMNQMSALAGEGVQVHVPQSFMNLLQNRFVAVDNTPPPAWVSIYAPGYPPSDLSFERLYRTMSDREDLIRPFSPDRRMREDHREFGQDLLRAMRERQPQVANDVWDSVLQEWIFLQERSWIVAQARGAFDMMKAAGSACLELQPIKVGSNILDKVVRKTRGKEEEEAIATLDRLITLGKWVAAGGGAVAAGGIVPLPPALAITIAISPRFFALIDP